MTFKPQILEWFLMCPLSGSEFWVRCRGTSVNKPELFLDLWAHRLAGERELNKQAQWSEERAIE